MVYENKQLKVLGDSMSIFLKESDLVQGGYILVQGKYIPIWACYIPV